MDTIDDWTAVATAVGTAVDGRGDGRLDGLRLRSTITIDLFLSYDGTIVFSTCTIDDTIGSSYHLSIPIL